MFSLTDYVNNEIADRIDEACDAAGAERKPDRCRDDVFSPPHYDGTRDKISVVVDGLPADFAVDLFDVLKYFDRAGRKPGESRSRDLAKANNYAHRLATGRFRDEVDHAR